MDFFDPQKQKRHAIRLAIGYAVIGTVLLLATTILLHWAYGYGLDKEGKVIQNGLVFVSTRPEGADAYMNGKRYKDQTNTRINVPSGQYLLELKRNGYHDWKRALTVEGGKLQRFDYPLLFPKEIKTTVTKQYDAPPTLNSVSIDKRWLLVSTSNHNFDLFDLNAENPQSVALNIPSEILAANSATTNWQLLEWAKDNRHVLLRRLYNTAGQPGSEYILLDRERPDLSQNLTIKLGFTPTHIELRNQAYDRYYAFDQNSGQVFTATLDSPTPQPYLSEVLAFTSERDTVVYATTEGADVGRVNIRIKVADNPSLTVRQVPAGTGYLLELALYQNKLYLAAGASSENRVFLYRDPIATLKARPNEPLAPVQILKVTAPNHVSFSANARFVIAQNGDQFAVYDAETDRGYGYRTNLPIDAPQTRATWMDGFRLCYVSGGKVVVFDFDGTNLQNLSAASSNHRPAFDRDYRYMYTIDAQNAVSRTALLTEEDL